METLSNRRHPNPDDHRNFAESPQENRYGPIYKVDFRDGRRPVFGQISRIEPRLGYFLFLERGAQDQVGMLGSDGVRYNFDECKGVYEEDRHSPGFYGGDEQIHFWKQKAGVM
jgi:hypothetical protein